MWLPLLTALREMGASSTGTFATTSRVLERALGNKKPLADLERFLTRRRPRWELSARADVQMFALVVDLVEPYLSRYPLLEGRGNFGSLDGDPPAGPDFSECRLTPIGEAVLDGTISNAL